MVHPIQVQVEEPVAQTAAASATVPRAAAATAASAAAAASPANSNEPSSAEKEVSSPPRKKTKVKHGLKRLKGKGIKKAVVSSNRPHNKAEKDAIKQPSMWKYVKLPIGRPTKEKEPTIVTELDTNTTPSAEASTTTNPSATATKRKKKNTNWNEGVHKEAMAVALQSMVETSGLVSAAIKAAQERYPTILIPRQTLESRYKKMQKEMAAVDDGKDVDLAKFDRTTTDMAGRVKGSLTSAADRAFLQSLAVARDNRNCGMSRKELISIIAELTNASWKKAENHYDHLIRTKQLDKLKNDGRVVRAQATTTNRTAITTEKLLRMYSVQEEAWAIQNELNGWDTAKMTPDELMSHQAVRDAHTMNLDESSLLASEGIIRVIGARSKSKHEKNLADSRDSITVVRCGSAAGVDGPRIYLAKGKDIELQAFKNFTANFDAPAGSCIEMTPSAYMTDEAWTNIGPSLCKGIRAMKGVQADCWVVLSLDGFGSHLTPDQLLVFSDYKILVIKEEGDTSQVCQAYDQIVAKEDKRRARELLDTIKRFKKNPINQWDLILILNEALNEVAKSQAWRTSFIRVNFCPSKRVPFKDWVTNHADTVEAADRFFKHRYGLFDAMPACWKRLTEEERRQLCAVMDACPRKWTVEHVKSVLLLGFAKLEDMDKLRACYFVAKEDESVFVTSISFVDEEDDDEPSPSPSMARQWLLDKDYHGYAFAPSDLMKEYLQDKNDNPSDRNKDIAAALFCRMSNFVAANHGWHKGSDLVPSNYLHVEITQDQIDLLNPTPRDVQIGAILDQCAGVRATKAIAKRRVDMISGNINSYARILNGPSQLDKIKSYNQLAASMAIVRRERDEKTEAAKQKKKQDDVEKAAKKAEKEQKAREEKERLGPVCNEHVQKGLAHVLGLKVDQRKEILRIHFGLATVEVNGVSVPVYKLNKDGTEAALRSLIDVNNDSSLTEEHTNGNDSTLTEDLNISNENDDFNDDAGLVVAVAGV
eukprot:scaffold11931_cov56-Cyclotella_meneghiniana.AAC.4